MYTSLTAEEIESARQFIKGKRVLITGVGSIGGELARQIYDCAPGELVLFDNCEYNLYKVHHDLREAVPILGDVRDGLHIERVFNTYRPQIVYHAAALKHVPLAEKNPEETILTNVFGTQNVWTACEQISAAMVLISTDKAVNPVCVMGASKRLAERLAHGVTVRFGNVLDSSGSVLPLFRRQMEAGGPLTVTHPDMTRYFMTIGQAVSLTLQASVKRGLFILEMGKPVRILDMAIDMIGDSDVGIKFIGLRPGEKLHEELRYAHEEKLPVSEEDLAALYEACVTRNGNALSLLAKMVPEYA